MTKKGTILIVEDDKDLLEANRLLLSESGDCEVYTASSLEEARHILKTKSVTPNVTVLDIMLPDGSGLDLIAELRDIYRSSIVLLTARTKKKDKLAGLAKGAVRYMTKPYDIDEFQMTVMNLLDDIVVSRRPSVLSKGDYEVARLIAAGYSNKKIAEALCLTENCIKMRLTRAYKKYGFMGNDNEKRMKLAGFAH